MGKEVPATEKVESAACPSTWLPGSWFPAGDPAWALHVTPLWFSPDFMYAVRHNPQEEPSAVEKIRRAMELGARARYGL